MNQKTNKIKNKVRNKFNFRKKTKKKQCLIIRFKLGSCLKNQ